MVFLGDVDNKLYILLPFPIELDWLYNAFSLKSLLRHHIGKKLVYIYIELQLDFVWDCGVSSCMPRFSSTYRFSSSLKDALILGELAGKNTLAKTKPNIMVICLIRQIVFQCTRRKYDGASPYIYIKKTFGVWTPS